jgi:hypothetical protein
MDEWLWRGWVILSLLLVLQICWGVMWACMGVGG